MFSIITPLLVYGGWQIETERSLSKSKEETKAAYFESCAVRASVVCGESVSLHVCEHVDVSVLWAIHVMAVVCAAEHTPLPPTPCVKIEASSTCERLEHCTVAAFNVLTEPGMAGNENELVLVKAYDRASQAVFGPILVLQKSGLRTYNRV